jgi:chromosome segregation ATPase
VKKDVNFIFFGLLLLLMIAMAGVMLYSDYTYHKVNGDYIRFKQMYDKAQDDLNQSKTDVRAKEMALDEKERELIDIVKELNLSKQKESSLSGYYVTVKSEKEQLNESLSTAISARDRYKADYESSRLTLSVCQRDIELEKKTVSTCQANLLSYRVASADAALKAEQLMAALDTFSCKNKTVCDDDLGDAVTMLETLQAKLNSMKTP